MYRKNVAGQYLYFSLVNATTGAALTGATVTGKRAIDGVAQASVTGTITEEAGGQYKIALSQADINGNNIGFLFTATNAIPVSISVVTTAADPTDSVRFGLTALPNAAAGAANGLPLSVDSSGRVDVLKINGTSQTARDIGASVLLSTGTGTGQLDFTSGVVKANVTQLLGTAWLAPAVAGTPDVNAKQLGGTAQTGRDVGASVLVGDKTGFALTAGEHTSIASDAQTGLTAQGYTTTRAGYLDTLNGLVQAIWDKATSALTTVGSIGKLLVTNLDAAISSRLATSGYTTPPTTGAISAAVVDQALSGHTTAGTVGAALSAASSAGDPWSTALPGAYGAGTAGAIVGNKLDAQVSTVVSRLGTPAGASIAADLAEIEGETDAIQAKTDQLTFTTANRVDATVTSGNPNTYQVQGSGDSPFLGR